MLMRFSEELGLIMLPIAVASEPKEIPPECMQNCVIPLSNSAHRRMARDEELEGGLPAQLSRGESQCP